MYNRETCFFWFGLVWFVLLCYQHYQRRWSMDGSAAQSAPLHPSPQGVPSKGCVEKDGNARATVCRNLICSVSPSNPLSSQCVCVNRLHLCYASLVNLLPLTPSILCSLPNAHLRLAASVFRNKVMSTTPTSYDCNRASYPQQLQSHIETLLLLFLRDFCAEGASPTRSGYRASHLQTIAQAFYVLQIVQCSVAPRREQETSHSILQRSGGTTYLDVCTERDLYYRNPPLFAPRGQRATHDSIKRLCSWLEVVARVHPHQQREGPLLTSLFRSPRCLLSRLWRGTQGTASLTPLHTRESLGITAAGKSVLVGAVLLELCDPSELIDVSACGSVGITLTYPLAVRMVGCREAGGRQAARDGISLTQRYKLVLIEKESVHHALLQSMTKGGTSHTCSYVLLCIKGYPCVAAREWLRRVHALWPSLQIYIMVDGDPHGLCIALTVMGLLGSKGCPSPIVSLQPNPTSSSFPSRSGATPASAETTKVKELLPLHFLGVCPSLVWSCDSHSEVPLSAGRLGGLAPSEGIPLTTDDVQVLKRIASNVQAALVSTPEKSDSATSLRGCETAIVRRTLQRVLKEAEWMQRSRIKCELQFACGPMGPVTFMEQHMQRCDVESSERY
ncbi:hypothetical protein, conserved [Leishmania tarentolae]|uniref:Topoisomerase 6 subunit A/Spo11 TOPRIM domain-containing protein n=1 Tax=Leishmania tarentolae TaxID=5689 RepID=A0A640KUU0_LEITA|nr:hypothetical protein, conserved [Leishmania tarentolae]